MNVRAPKLTGPCSAAGNLNIAKSGRDVDICIGAGGKKCLMDESVPEYPANVYYCEDPAKTKCCIEDGQGSCCEPNESITMYVRHSNCSFCTFIICVIII